MATLLKKIEWKWRALLALFALAIPVAAYAAISSHNLNANLRTQQVEYTFVRRTTAQPSVQSATATTTGGGVVWAATISNNRSPCSTVNLGGCPKSSTNGTDTGTITALPYPARLAFSLVDRSSNSAALSCTSLNITGIDVFGNRRSEAFTTVDETQRLTTYAYEKLEFAKFLGCTLSTGVNTDDFVRIYVSEYIGIPFKISRRQDVISLCRIPYHVNLRTSDSSPKCISWADADEISVDTTANTIRLTNELTTNDPLFFDHGDKMILRIRGTATY